MRGGFGVVRGTELVDFGSRQPFVEPIVWAELELAVLATRRVGVAFDGVAAATSFGRDEAWFGRFDFAALFPLFERDGARGVALVLGAGLGAAFGDRYWWENVRGYPYALARFAWLPTRRTSIWASVSCAPVDTGVFDGRHAVESRFELGGSVGLFAAGARVALTAVAEGDPRRTYGDVEVGFFLALHVPFTPAGRRR